jgi:hypothetical protein
MGHRDLALEGPFLKETHLAVSQTYSLICARSVGFIDVFPAVQLFSTRGYLMYKQLNMRVISSYMCKAVLLVSCKDN